MPMKAERKRQARAEVYRRARGRCEYCTAYCGHSGTLDHWMPKALCGGNDLANLRWACHGCNTLKADMHPHEWEKQLPALVRLTQQRAPTSVENRRAMLLAGIARKAQEVTA